MWHEPLDLFGPGLRITPVQLLILAAFLGLVLGYLLALLINRRQQSIPLAGPARDKERAAGNVAFMKGINYILSEKHDRAIEELTRAVSVDTETVETYVALGNLFRRTGEIDRAIRIRQSIILRPNLDEKVRLQALFDLGLDYRRGGFYDRAVGAFEDLARRSPKWIEPWQQLAQIYEETRDWEKAFQTQEKVDRLKGARAANVLAHYQVEMGKVNFDRGQLGQARAAYKKAMSLDPGCVDAYLHLGDLQLKEGKPKKALDTWRRLIKVAPDMTYLTFERLARLAAEMKDLRPLEDFLYESAEKTSRPLAYLALARLHADHGLPDRAVEDLEKALAREPALVEAHRELGRLLLSQGREREALAAYRELLDNLARFEAVFQCGRCGFESRELMWRCPQCYAWDTMNLGRNRPMLFQPPTPPPAPSPGRPETEGGAEVQEGPPHPGDAGNRGA
ncbi:MAG: tetratricopeptide repeat protein [Thermodesulfobacteriota bacterium]